LESLYLNFGDLFVKIQEYTNKSSILKYKDFTVKILEIWPFFVGAVPTIDPYKSCSKYLNDHNKVYNSRYPVTWQNFNPFYLFTIYILHKYWRKLLEDEPQGRVETCRNYRVVIVRTLYCDVDQFLAQLWGVPSPLCV